MSRHSCCPLVLLSKADRLDAQFRLRTFSVPHFSSLPIFDSDCTRKSREFFSAGRRGLYLLFTPETRGADQTTAHYAGCEPQCPWSQQVGGSALLVPATSSRSHARLSRSFRPANGLVLGHPVPRLLTSLHAWPLPRGPRGPTQHMARPRTRAMSQTFSAWASLGNLLPMISFLESTLTSGS